MNISHILLVDDDLYAVESLKAYLELMGYRVSRAYGLNQAKERLRSLDKIDLVILDYLMPDGSGMDLLQSLGQELDIQRPRVIMASGIVDQNDPVWTELRNRLPAESKSLIQAYISKPYSFEAMDEALCEVLGGDYRPDPVLRKALP